MWLSMWVPITVMVVAGMVRLACSLACWLMGMCSDRRRGRIAVTLLRAAGPGSLVLDRHPDGSVLIVQAGGLASAARASRVVSR
jgi:hypothetical protein